MKAQSELYISGYTEAPYGVGPGIVRYGLADDGLVSGVLSKSEGIVNPSFLAWGGPSRALLLAVEELPEGKVVALEPKTLMLTGRAATAGADPCHLVRHQDTVWAANYSSGTVSCIELPELLANLEPEPELLEHQGSGPVTERQSQSHAHQVVPTPWDSILVSDLGADRVDEYSPESLNLLGSALLPPGTGPRHIGLHITLYGDFLLVAGELDGHLHVLRKAADAGQHEWQWLFKTPLAASAEAVETAIDFAPSHLEIVGNLVYVAVRGPNTIVVLDASGLNSETSEPPSFLAAVASGGNWPRHFAIEGERMYVANQLSDAVAVLALTADGIPAAEPLAQIEHGSPTCVLLR